MTILVYLLALYALWWLYLGVMNLKRAKDAGTISRVALWLGYPGLGIGIALDWLVNVMLSVPFLDLPATPTELVTGRLKRYAYGDGYGFTWRQRAAYWFAEHLLDPFDPSGKHI